MNLDLVVGEFMCQTFIRFSWKNVTLIKKINKLETNMKKKIRHPLLLCDCNQLGLFIDQDSGGICAE